MKESNILKKFPSGWIVGLTASNNNVHIESPKKHHFTTYLLKNGSLGVGGPPSLFKSIPAEVREMCHGLLKKRMQLRKTQSATRVEDDFSDSESDDTYDEIPTMEELGFKDGVAHLDCIPLEHD